MKELNLQAVPENLQRVLDFVAEQIEGIGMPLKIQMQIQIAVEEIFVNIAHYAYHPEIGIATVRIEVIDDPLQVIITFIDHGTPYDPLKKEDPDITLPLSQREIGGLGIFMVKKSMDDISYEYKDGKNILAVRKVVE